MTNRYRIYELSAGDSFTDATDVLSEEERSFLRAIRVLVPMDNQQTPVFLFRKGRHGSLVTTRDIVFNVLPLDDQIIDSPANDSQHLLRNRLLFEIDGIKYSWIPESQGELNPSRSSREPDVTIDTSSPVE